MNLQEALKAAKNGNFVINEYFSSDQSMHYWNGKFYYEDGAVVTRDFLESQNFAKNGKWKICIPAKKVDKEKLSWMHQNAGGLMLQQGSFMECILNENGKQTL